MRYLDESDRIIIAGHEQASAVGRDGEGIDARSYTGNETRLRGILRPDDHNAFLAARIQLTGGLGELNVEEGVSVPVEGGCHFLPDHHIQDTIPDGRSQLFLRVISSPPRLTASIPLARFHARCLE